MPLHSNCLHGIAIARHAGNFEVDIASAPPSLNGNIAPSNVLATNADFILLCTTIIKSLLLPQAQACYGRLVPSLLHDDVVDDKAKYDRATRPQLIEDFKAWVAGDGPKSEVNDEELEKVYGPPHPYLSKLRTSDPARFEKRPGDPQYLDSPRYRFFIQVDQECLDSVLAIDDPIKYMAPLGGAPYAGWVNIVNSRWPLNSPIALEDAYRPRPNDPTDLAISADEAIPCS